MFHASQKREICSNEEDDVRVFEGMWGGGNAWDFMARSPYTFFQCIRSSFAMKALFLSVFVLLLNSNNDFNIVL